MEMPSCVRYSLQVLRMTVLSALPKLNPKTSVLDKQQTHLPVNSMLVLFCPVGEVVHDDVVQSE